MQSFSFIPLVASEEMIFETFFANLAFPLPWQQMQDRGLDKNIRNKSNFHFSNC